MDISGFLASHPAINFVLYLNFCLVAWGVSLCVYEKVTPCREWKLIQKGNMAAAMSLSGAAIGMAIPLASLVTHSAGWGQLALWTCVSLFTQLAVWFVLGRLAFPNLGASLTEDNRSVGMFVGASGVSIGVMVGACVS